ncbi:hypothetical protein VTK73DRAFT_1661 [Phialemonium thermophilum]|uniref:Mitochondrial adapter protein MCP1 transmembrane domain-containing protein n=1 Tax=Phialemonium thermophilum TaxID=223376 RepID=A0ABR3X9G9_9PEZI
MDSMPLHEKASQETFISLLQLDPAPIDSPREGTENNQAPLSKEASSSPGGSPGTTTSVGLSGTSRGAIFYLLRVQRYSSYALGIFTSFHLVTTSIIPLVTRSVPASESYLLLAREIYQTPLSEPLLVCLPAVAHVVSGIALRLVRRSHNLRRYGGATPGIQGIRHRYARNSHTVTSHAESPSFVHTRIWPVFSNIALSGYAFAVLVGIHAFVNRGLPLIVEGDSANIGLAYIAHGFARHPITAWLAYPALLAAGCGHITWGAAKWLGFAQAAAWSPPPPTGNVLVDRRARKRRRRTWLAIQAAALIFTSLWAAGGLGVVARAGSQQGWLGELYDGLFDRIPGL